jgi:hypothetical protein
MTDNTVDLGAKRKERAPRCDICGKPLHDFIGECRRVGSVTNEVDGAVTWHLIPLDDEPTDAA